MIRLSGSRVRWTLAAIAVVVLGHGAAQADGGAPPAAADDGAIQQVIPPGQEETLATMLGRGAQLPGDCAFTNGQVERTSVIATYGCRTGEVVIDLRHPSGAPPDAPRTERFALVVRDGTPPDGLRDALLQLVRAHESAVEWKEVGAPAAAGAGGALLPIAAGALVVVVLLIVVRRLLSRRGAGSA
jgi:hypothetical protein